MNACDEWRICEVCNSKFNEGLNYDICDACMDDLIEEED